MKNRIRLLLLLAAIILSVVLLSLFHQEKDAVDDAIAVNAVDLWIEMKYGENDIADYDGVLYEITGEVSEVADFFMGHPCIVLENGEDTIPEGFFIMFPEGFDVFQYSVGETITITGKCSPGLHIYGDDSNPTVFFYVE